MYKIREKRSSIKLLAIIFFIAAALGGVYYVLNTYTIKNVYVEGNIHYTQDEIKDIVMEGPLSNNSLFLSLKFKNKGVENIPFVDVMDVKILAPDTIKIIVYEKALAGYVKYLDSYMYFDKDGYIVECSSIKTEGVPQITGLNFDYLVLGQVLPIADADIFTSIMRLTKLLNKYELIADKIYFNSSKDVVIYFQDVKVALGNDNSKLEEKVMLIPQLLTKVTGKKGAFRMENITEKNSIITFEPDTT